MTNNSSLFHVAVLADKSLEYYILLSFFIFYVFEWSLVCSPRLHLFDGKDSTNSTIVKYDYNLIY